MTTVLAKPFAREVEYEGVIYRAVLSARGVRMTPKGSRRGVTVSWERILAFDPGEAKVSDGGDVVELRSETCEASARLGMPHGVATDVLLLLKRAGETIVEASALIDRGRRATLEAGRTQEPRGR